MSECPESTPPNVVNLRPVAARAARIARFEREQLIVDYLNRGVSIAEIAARLGVGEKRMRAIIREVLARRMPAAPEAFVAIQVSRLNEALLVAFSAMTDNNLNAVDRVVKIVRELDRYHGVAAVGRRRPEPSPLKARRDGSIEHHAAPVRKRIAFSPTASIPPDDAGSDKAQSSLDAVAARPAPCLDLPPVNHEIGPKAPPALDDRPENPRPENPPQPIEKLESAPGSGTPTEPLDPAPASFPPDGALRGAGDNGAGRVADDSASSWLRALTRPGIPSQHLERFESAPGRAAPPRALALVGGTHARNAIGGVETWVAGTPRGAAGSTSESSLG